MKTTINQITGKKLFVFQSILEDDSIIQFASIYEYANKHPGSEKEKGKIVKEKIALGFKSQKDILKYFPEHYISKSHTSNLENTEFSIHRELFKK